MNKKDALIKEINEHLSNKDNWFEVKVKNNKFEIPSTQDIPTNTKGIYFIRTNVSVKELENCIYEYKREDGKKDLSKNLPEIIGCNKKLIENSLTLKEEGEGLYIVYNGKASNIRGRIGDHFGTNDSGGTGCLALERYDILKKYNWEVAFIKEDNPSMRTFKEQLFRISIGWPVLCYE